MTIVIWINHMTVFKEFLKTDLVKLQSGGIMTQQIMKAVNGRLEKKS